MSDMSARITTLKRYISLLRQEERRLKWITTSTSVTNVENIEAAANLKVISEKLIRARENYSVWSWGLSDTYKIFTAYPLNPLQLAHLHPHLAIGASIKHDPR